MNPKKYFIGIVLFLSALAVKASDMVIVNNGVSHASIVLPANASAQLKNAANILQSYIKQSTNALLPIVGSVPANQMSIQLGVTSVVAQQNINYKSLDDDAFILQKINNNTYAIVGGSDWGSEFGVYYFLEHFLQIYWLMPTTAGVDVPQKSSLIINDDKIVRSPAYISRQISPIVVNSNDALGVWGRFNGLHDRINFHHNLINLFNPQKFGKTNPEFFPMIKGRRQVPAAGDHQWQPDFSARALVDSATVEISQYFKTHPNDKSYSLGINDSHNFDDGALARSKRNGKMNYLGQEDESDDYFNWANKVAEKVNKTYPNKLFGTLAYDNIAEPPSGNIGVNPNIVPFITYERARWSDPQLKAHDQALTKRWTGATSRTGWYDYAYGFCYLLPRVYFHTMQDYLSWGSNNNVKYYYAELYPNWGEGPKAWLLTKLLWDPNQNVDVLLDQWYTHTAGSAAAPKLKEFYAIWEKFWTQDIYSSKWNNSKGQYLPFNNLTYMNAVPADYIAKSDALMNQAYALADSPQRKIRVARLREMWQIYKLAAQLCSNTPTLASARNAILRSAEFNNRLTKFQSDSLFSLAVKSIRNSFSFNSQTSK